MPDIADTNLPAKDVVRHLSHELRQPLSALESIAFYLQMTAAEGGTDLTAQVNRLQQMVDSANWVLSDVLYLLHMNPPNPEDVELDELTEEVLTEAWVGEGLSIEWDFEEFLPPARADLEQLRHLLRSVLHFLRRTVDGLGTIEMSAAAVNRTIYLSIRTWAPALNAESLFNPLQGNQLFTCRRIAENNAGRFHAEKDDRGCLCLRLDLPAASPH
ncbi:MAG: HAMP domain-containing histidine kinase [Acidobacteria bacterium]|nr:HAMP domain-containing histidine kinase [Acidobacteriota bacterium]